MAVPNDTPPADVLLAALRNSRARLVENATPLSADQARMQSYDTEWSVGQVLSHIATGSIFFKLILEAGLAGEPAPGGEVMQPIWAEWDAKTPEAQARDAIVVDGELVAAFEALTQEQRDEWQLNFFGTDRDFAGLVQMRLGEHSIHTWDFVVALDPKAQLLPDAVDVLIDSLEPLVSRAGKPLDSQLVVGIETEDPARNFVLTIDADGATLGPLDARFEADTLLALPAESFIRLVYGRLDPEHTPPGVDDPVLDTLRTVFVGF